MKLERAFEALRSKILVANNYEDTIGEVARVISDLEALDCVDL
jgi:hypothetical protein